MTRPCITHSWDELWHELETAGVCWPVQNGRDHWYPPGLGKQVADAVEELQQSGRLSTGQIEAVTVLLRAVIRAARYEESTPCPNASPAASARD